MHDDEPPPRPAAAPRGAHSDADRDRRRELDGPVVASSARAPGPPREGAGGGSRGFGAPGRIEPPRRRGGADERFLDDEEEDERMDAGLNGEDAAHGGDLSSAAPPPPLPPGPAPPAPTPAAFEIPEGVDEEEFMARMMGFSGFDSTKGKHVEDNDTTAAKGAAAKVLKREYRQYMNRKGGFNKPLATQKPITRK